MPVCLLVYDCVCMCVCKTSVTEDSRDTKNLSRAQSAAVQRSPLPPSLSCFHHMMFFIFQPFLIHSLLGTSCPFPSVSCPSATQIPNNSRLCLPQAWTSSTSWLWQASVSKQLMLLLGTGRNWLHKAGLLLFVTNKCWWSLFRPILLWLKVYFIPYTLITGACLTNVTLSPRFCSIIYPKSYSIGSI